MAKVALASIILLLFAACGGGAEQAPTPIEGGSGGEVPGEGGSGGDAGGGGGDEGPDETNPRTIPCARMCERMEICDAMPTGVSPLQCIAGCVADDALDDATIFACTGCMAKASCESLLDDTACLAECRPPHHGLEVQGRDLAAYAGMQLHLALNEGEFGNAALRRFELDGEDFDIFLEDVIWPGSTLTVDAHVDANGNDLCDPETDPVHRFPLSRVLEDRTIELRADLLSSPAGCETFVWLPYDLGVRGQSFGVPDGAPVKLSLEAVHAGEIFHVDEAETMLSAGAFSVDFSGGLYGEAEAWLRFFIDGDADGRCGPADFRGEARIEPPSFEAATLELDSSSAADVHCSVFPKTGFDVRVTGLQYNSFEGNRLMGILVDEGGRTVARGLSIVRNGRFDMLFEREAHIGTRYRVRYFVDRNLDGVCALTDVAFSVDVPVIMGNVDVSAPGQLDADPSGCAGF